MSCFFENFGLFVQVVRLCLSWVEALGLFGLKMIIFDLQWGQVTFQTKSSNSLRLLLVVSLLFICGNFMFVTGLWLFLVDIILALYYQATSWSRLIMNNK